MSLLLVKIGLDLDQTSEDMLVKIFDGKMSLLPVFLDLCHKAGASRLNAPCPSLAPRGCQLTHLLTPRPLGLGVHFAADTWDSLEPSEIVVQMMKKESQEVMLRSQLSRRQSCRLRHSKLGSHLGV